MQIDCREVLTLFSISILCISIFIIIFLIHIFSKMIEINRLVKLIIYIVLWVIIPVTIWLFVINKYNVKELNLVLFIMVYFFYSISFWILVFLKASFLCMMDWLTGIDSFYYFNEYFRIFPDL
jgi:hypothetical protein